MKIATREALHDGRKKLVTLLIWDFGYVEVTEFDYYDGKYSDIILATKPLLDFMTICVLPEYRGKGKTETMMKAVSRFAREHGFKGVYSCAFAGLHDETTTLDGLVKLFSKHGYDKEYENVNPPFVGMLKLLN